MKDFLTVYYEKFENDELTYIKEIVSQNEQGGADLWYDSKEKIYYCAYGRRGVDFTDYCNVECSTNKNKLIASVKQSLKMY